MGVISEGSVGPGPDDWFEEFRKIAEVVESFSSESIQVRVFDMLLRWRFGSWAESAELGIGPAAVSEQTPTASGQGDLDECAYQSGTTQEEDTFDSAGENEVAAGESKKAGGRRHRHSNRRREPVRNIDFRPDGQTWFRDFVEEKQPSNLHQRNVLAVYWLQYYAGIMDIGVGHVLAAYKECSWREPTNPENALQSTASRCHWLDTHDMASIAVTPSGRNAVQYDMPTGKSRKR